MIRSLFLLLALGAAPVMAQDHQEHDHAPGHDHHLAEADGLRAVHAWTNATQASHALVYVDLENTSRSRVTLTGGASDISANMEIVGFENAGGELRYTVIPQMPVEAGSKVALSPNGLALRLEGLARPLNEGDTFMIRIEFSNTSLDAVVDVQSAKATQHSHAGHHHR
ncbi:MAG: copper chaperone PCu(A)C [Alphaproteobacteria bacterium]|nr:copper chaperone PCu(A)C [Alphaproteobacteria bacterium]